jgi:hypothetical protein
LARNLRGTGEKAKKDVLCFETTLFYGLRGTRREEGVGRKRVVGRGGGVSNEFSHTLNTIKHMQKTKEKNTHFLVPSLCITVMRPVLVLLPIPFPLVVPLLGLPLPLLLLLPNMDPSILLLAAAGDAGDAGDAPDAPDAGFLFLEDAIGLLKTGFSIAKTPEESAFINFLFLSLSSFSNISDSFISMLGFTSKLLSPNPCILISLSSTLSSLKKRVFRGELGDEEVRWDGEVLSEDLLRREEGGD